MVTIIKRGNKKTHTCETCGCYFSYDREDVEIYDNVNGYSESIKCPQCETNITLIPECLMNITSSGKWILVIL